MVDNSRSGSSSAVMEKLSKKDKYKFKEIARWNCLQVFMFLTFMLNLCYTLFLPDALHMVANTIMSVADALNIEMHFIRFVHLSFFDKA